MKLNKKIIKLNKLLSLIALAVILSGLVQSFDINQEHISFCGDQPNITTKNIATFSMDENLTNVSIEIENNIPNLLITPISIHLDNYTANEEINLGSIQIESSCEEQNVGTLNINVNENGNNYANEIAFTIAINPSTANQNPPNIIKTEPEGNIDSSAIMLKVETDQNTICKYDNSRTIFDEMQYTFNGVELTHSANLYLDKGEYNFKVVCRNENNILSIPKTITFSINSPEAKIIDYNPKEYSENWDNILRISTLNTEKCYYTYDLSTDDTAYMLPTMSISQTYQELFFDRNHDKIKMICENEFGKKSESKIITLKKIEENKATILINKKEITSGIFEVEVIFNLDTKNPKLKYQLISSGTNRIIPLEGEGNQWHGLFSIEESTAKQIGEFILQENEEDVTIIKGKYFIVDPVKPKKVTTIQISQKGNAVYMQWFSPSKDTKTYNIYRKENNSQVDEFDLYDITRTNNYEDENIKLGNTYYYRISPVDEYGNEGLLSTVKSQKIEETKNSEKKEVKTLSANKLELINKVQNKLNEKKKKLNAIKLITKNKLLNKEYFYNLQTNANLITQLETKIESILSKATATMEEIKDMNNKLEQLEKELNKYPNKITESKEEKISINIPDEFDEFDVEIIRTLRLEPDKTNIAKIKNMRYNEKETEIVTQTIIKEINISTNNKTKTIYELSVKTILEGSIFFIILPKEFTEDQIIQTSDENSIIETNEGLAIKISTNNNANILLEDKPRAVKIATYKEKNETNQNLITANVLGLTGSSSKWGLISLFMLISIGLIINLTINSGTKNLSEDAKEQKKFKTKYIIPVTNKGIKIKKINLKSMFDIYEYLHNAKKTEVKELMTKKNEKIAAFITNNYNNNKLANKIKEAQNKDALIEVIAKNCKKRGIRSWFTNK